MAGKTTPTRIHGLLDDASRYVLALDAHTTEKEVDTLGMLVDALRRHGKPDALYLDNGSTCRGEILSTARAPRHRTGAAPRVALFGGLHEPRADGP